MLTIIKIYIKEIKHRDKEHDYIIKSLKILTIIVNSQDDIIEFIYKYSYYINANCHNRATHLSRYYQDSEINT